MKIKLLIIFFLTFTGFIFVSLNFGKVSAATVTWLGYNSNMWSDDENWDVPPQEGDDLIFPYDSPSIMNCDVGYKVFKSMTFDDSYEMTCPNIYVSESMTQYSARSLTVNAQINLEGDVTINTAAYTFFTQGINLNDHNVNLNVGYAFLNVAGFTGYGNIIKTGYPLTLTDTSSFIGTLTIGSGQVIANVSNSLPTNSYIVLEAGELILEDSTTNTIRGLSGEGAVNIMEDAVLNLEDDSEQLQFDGVFTGSGTINKKATNNIRFNTESPLFTGQISVQSGSLTLEGDLSNAPLQINGGVFTGMGRIGSINCSAGILSPGHTGIGILNVEGSVVLEEDCMFVGFFMPPIGEEISYAQVIIDGNLTLNDPMLAINPGYSPVGGDEFNFLKTTGGTTTGTFAMLPDSTVFPYAFSNYLIEYRTSGVYITALYDLQQLAISVNPSSPKVGQVVTITFTATGANGTPTGVISLYDESELIGDFPLTNGVATVQIDSFTEGTHNLSGIYSGDLVYDTFESDNYELVITAVEPIQENNTDNGTNNNVANTNSSSNQNVTNYQEVSSKTEIIEPASYTVSNNNQVQEDNIFESNQNTENTKSLEDQPENDNSSFSWIILILILLGLLAGIYILKNRKNNF